MVVEEEEEEGGGGVRRRRLEEAMMAVIKRNARQGPRPIAKTKSYSSRRSAHHDQSSPLSQKASSSSHELLVAVS